MCVFIYVYIYICMYVFIHWVNPTDLRRLISSCRALVTRSLFSAQDDSDETDAPNWRKLLYYRSG